MLEAVPEGPRTFWVWLLVLGSSFMMLVGLARAGTRLFWRQEPWPDASPEHVARYVPREQMREAPSRPLETAGTVLLLAYDVAVVVGASPMLEYTRARGNQVQAPEAFIQPGPATAPQGETAWARAHASHGRAASSRRCRWRLRCSCSGC